MSIFTGAGVALVTPTHADGSVNYEKMKELIEFQLANDTDALIICGTTGEASTMDDASQIECVRYAKEVAAGRVPVIAGAGSNDTVHCIELAQGCEKAGADAVLLVTPYYNKATQKGLILHYTKIANSIKIPVILYNVPGRTGCNLSPNTVYELSKVENIVAVKEASGNLSQVAEIAALCGPDFDIYSGNDDQILPILSLGGKGVISVLSNIAPKNTHDMVYLIYKAREDDLGNLTEQDKKNIKKINDKLDIMTNVNMAQILREQTRTRKEINYKIDQFMLQNNVEHKQFAYQIAKLEKENGITRIG